MEGALRNMVSKQYDCFATCLLLIISDGAIRDILVEKDKEISELRREFEGMILRLICSLFKTSRNEAIIRIDARSKFRT
jgi:hypothetical protein